MRFLLCVLFLCLSSFPALAGNPRVALTTSAGVIVVELDEQQAPLTVENFLRYVKDGFYEGTIFHRVIKGFMIQGGGMDVSLTPKKGRAPIKNEAANGLKNDRYTIAMARTSEVDSATSQFFINTATNDFLNNGVRDYGYAVFGKVVQGREVVDVIEQAPTGMQDVPRTPVVIEKAEILQ